MLACLFMAGALARAGVTITCDKRELQSREACILRAVPDAGGEHEWRWSLPGLEGARPALKRISSCEVRFTAPPTRAGSIVTVLLEDARNASIRAEFRVAVVPNPRLGCPEWQEKDELAPGAFTPSLSRFHGDPEASAGGQAHLPRASKVCFCEDAFAGGPEAQRRLNRGWIVAGAHGLQAFSAGGEALLVPGAPRPGAGRICRAVAVLPPGADPDPAAPRLVYSESKPDPFGTGLDGDEDTRIFALALDGTRRELDLGEPLTLGGPRTVRDLALDREGNVFVALSGGRGIWKITPAGAVGLHALIPEPDTPGPGEGGGVLPDGLRALALDPATGRLYAGDGLGVHRVDPDGAMTAIYAPEQGESIRPCHLAVHGGELLIIDTHRPGIQALHLESRKLTTLLGSAGKRGGATTRLGPIHRLNPDLAPDSCAALGAVGSLASNQEGLCLLGAGGGLAMLDLPRGAITGAPEPEEGEALPPRSAGAPALSNRQANLERSRSIQLRNRLHKKEQRLGLELAARKRVLAANAPSQAPSGAVVEAAPVLPQGTRRPSVRNLGRVGLWILMAGGAVADPAWAGPSSYGTSAQGAGSFASSGTHQLPMIPILAAQANAALDPLGMYCGPILFAGEVSGPCAPGYRAGVLAQLDDLFAQMDRIPRRTPRRGSNWPRGPTR
jgi:hypothetical protein